MISYLIVLLPILFQFASPISVLSLGELLLAFVVLKEVISRKGKFSLNRRDTWGLLSFYFVPVLLILAAINNSYFEIAEAATVVARIIFYYVLIIVALNKFNVNKAINLYFILSCLACVYLLFQVVSHYVLHTDIPILVNYNDILFFKKTITETARYYSHYGFRPSSFFIEPSFFADYMMPISFIMLYKTDLYIFSKKMTIMNRIAYAILFSIAILLSTSSLGIVYICIVWGGFIFTNYSGIHINKEYKMLTITVIFVLIIYVLNSEVFSASINRFLSGSSIGARVYRGFSIFANLNLHEIVFGVGLNNIGNFVKYNNITTIYDEIDLNYTVTLTNRLVATGVVGTCSLFYFWFSQFLSKGKFGKIMLLAIMVSFIFANGEYTSGFPFFFIWMTLIDKSEMGRAYIGNKT